MSVVHVVAAGEIGGAERMLVDLMAHGTGSIALLTPNDALRRLFLDAGLTIDDRGPIRESRLGFLRPGDVGWLTEVLARRGAKIVHLHTFASQVLGTRAAKRAGARIVRTEHSTRVYDDPSCRPFARWSLRRADRIVFISDHVRRVALKRMPFLSSFGTTVIHNGVDTEHFTVAPTRAAAGGWGRPTGEAPFLRGPVRPRAGLSGAEPLTLGRVRFVALGRLDPRKGLDLAIEAIGRVANAELEIVGDGEERRRLEKLAGERVTFSGYASDVRAAIARSDAILSSSLEEGLGIALLEGMAMGRPVVAVPVGGIPEIVQDGTTGWLAASRSVSALAHVIAEAARDPAERDRRGAAARARVVAELSVAAMRAKYAEIYAALGA